jgi:thiol-disulfide isomerase/thioredoxin
MHQAPATFRGVSWLTRAAVGIATLLAGLVAQGAPSGGDLAPDYVGRTFDGDPILLSKYQGKVVVLSYWASWCGPCRKELPLLEGIQQAAGKDRVQVIAINIESLDTYRRLARRMTALQSLVAHDSNEEGRKAYGVVGIPHMVIVGKDGRVVRVNRGYNEEGVDGVIADVNRALAN